MLLVLVLNHGVVDVTNYNDGKRGGRIKVRAKINHENIQQKFLEN